MIESEIKVKIGQIKNEGYNHSENMVFDLRGTYDPEDPGYQLRY
jgi:hypothetical protein